MSTLARWRLQTPPWVEWMIVKPSNPLPNLERFLPEFLLYEFDSSRCQSAGELFAEFARHFGFPDYFGGNWDALHDCLTADDLAITDGCLILFKDANLLLCSSEKEFSVFQSVMWDCGEAWADPDQRSVLRNDDMSPVEPARRIPFHVVLLSSNCTDPVSRKWVNPVFEWNPGDIRQES